MSPTSISQFLPLGSVKTHHKEQPLKRVQKETTVKKRKQTCMQMSGPLVDDATSQRQLVGDHENSTARHSKFESVPTPANIFLIEQPGGQCKTKNNAVHQGPSKTKGCETMCVRRTRASQIGVSERNSKDSTLEHSTNHISCTDFCSPSRQDRRCPLNSGQKGRTAIVCRSQQSRRMSCFIIGRTGR